MKKKSLLTVIVMLSVFLVGIGTAHAIFGVPDDVKGQDLVWPMICAKNIGSPNTLNTNWAIADVVGGTPDAAGFASTASCTLYSAKSVALVDFEYDWTPLEVVVDDCQSLLVRHPGATTLDLDADGTPDLQQTIDTVNYWAGYISCTQVSSSFISPGIHDVTDRYMNNVYLVDPPLGFASGFNGPSLETGGAAAMAENASQVSMTAYSVYARYYLNNNNTNSWNWWIVLLSRNQYNTIARTSTRALNGFICDENEHCQSLQIGIPKELNIISVKPYLPGAPFFTPLGCNVPPDPPSVGCPGTQTFPKAGFAGLVVTESGTTSVPGNTFAILGTCNDPSAIAQGTCTSFYSLFGWSYERAEAGSILANFDVIHPMYRTYCSGGVSGTGGATNTANCICTGLGCI